MAAKQAQTTTTASQVKSKQRVADHGEVFTPKTLFRVGAEDAKLLASEVEPEFSSLDLQRLPNFEAVVKLMVQGEASGAFSVEMVRAKK